jgi:hypothetical protein
MAALGAADIGGEVLGGDECTPGLVGRGIGTIGELSAGKAMSDLTLEGGATVADTLEHSERDIDRRARARGGDELAVDNQRHIGDNIGTSQSQLLKSSPVGARISGGASTAQEAGLGNGERADVDAGDDFVARLKGTK